jgi:tyrosinase
MLMHFADTDDFTDYAHEGTGFPTWHRLFLLWLEREIQIEINDHTFRLPYWEWSDPSQREILFTRDRLGENVEGVVQGDLFTNWDTYCWEEMMSSPVPICDPTVSSGETLRRCPNPTLCKMDNPNWPTTADVKDAISIDTYDAYPYNRSVKGVDTSFRNYMEGFIVDPDTCVEDTLCSPQQGRAHEDITRKLHNTVRRISVSIRNNVLCALLQVHIILGLGDIKNAPTSFSDQGVMSCIVASPNDPIFINHHGKIDFMLEEWLMQNKDNLVYPQDNRIRQGHRGNDYIVPFIPLYTHEDMFKPADNFGYEYPDTGTACPRRQRQNPSSCANSSSFDGRACVGHILLGLSIVLYTRYHIAI